LRWLSAPAEAAEVPFIVEGYGDISVGVLEALCRHELFLGYEEASRDLAGFLDIVARFANDTTIVAGSEDVLPYTLMWGAQGLMTATPNFALGFMLDLFVASTSRDAATALAQFAKLREYRRLFSTELEHGVFAFVTYTKESLAALGESVGPPRSPLAPLSADRRQALRRVLEEVLLR
jgi:dihydrodipicolinate synthase/N-acetylneuraminate lyase